MKLPALIFAVLASALAVGACDSAEAVEEPPELVEEEEVVTLREQLVGLWQKEDVDDLEWLFKEGGSYLSGDINPINPIVGLWELEGDTLHIHDTACFDAFARYKISIDVNALTVGLILDECQSRGDVLPGVWKRFIYGQ